VASHSSATSSSQGLETDLYQLTMAAAYDHAGVAGPATFELFVRQMPPSRQYLIACGLEPALDYLGQLSFSSDDREWLRRLPQFTGVPASFFDGVLADFAFTGDVWAVPEGTPVFANEPILRVTAPPPVAQVVETALLSIVGFETSVATKAARVVDAAAGRSVIEFGARRAHGLGSALQAARAAYVGGCHGTSFVEAARRFGIPTSGTMAHSWVEAFPTEMEAFHEFSRLFADSAVYLLDTYDTLAAARHLAASDLKPSMVRLDSGNLPSLSREVRRILDEAGLSGTRIFATGDLDEYAIAALLASGAPIDGFGVGTALTTVSDAPALSAVYKLVAIQRGGAEIGVAKLSEGKETWPGAKQVWRRTIDGRIAGDLVAAADEAPRGGLVPLLECVMKEGRRVGEREELARSRARATAAIRALPPALRQFDGPPIYPVEVSEILRSRLDALRRARRD
jgi:nicotinate phosphoribosyltransferase